MLKNVSSKIRHGKAVKIVQYGDSISEVGRTPGYFGGATSEQANWGRQLAMMLQEKYPESTFTAASFAIGGQNTYEGLGRLDWLTPLEPDLVIIEFGANDCGFHFLIPEETQLALRSMIEGIKWRMPNADIIVAGTGGDNPLQSTMKHLDETIAVQQKAAEDFDLPYVNLRKAALQATDGGKRWEEFHNGPGDCHPNDAGHKMWAKAFYDVITEQLMNE